jgi:hypothetical protein
MKRSILIWNIIAIALNLFFSYYIIQYSIIDYKYNYVLLHIGEPHIFTISEILSNLFTYSFGRFIQTMTFFYVIVMGYNMLNNSKIETEKIIKNNFWLYTHPITYLFLFIWYSSKYAMKVIDFIPLLNKYLDSK